jgi:hypothetical protein
MQSQALFFISIAFSLIAWSLVATQIWPILRRQSRADALRPLLTLHAFRFIGLSFLIPGVVSPNLPAGFAVADAAGDLIAAMLALVALLLLSSRPATLTSTAAVWVFNLWGGADLLDAFFQGNRAGLAVGQLGATYFIPTVLVPMLLITHGMMFALLLRHQGEAAIEDNRQRA